MCENKTENLCLQCGYSNWGHLNKTDNQITEHKQWNPTKVVWTKTSLFQALGQWEQLKKWAGERKNELGQRENFVTLSDQNVLKQGRMALTATRSEFQSYFFGWHQCHISYGTFSYKSIAVDKWSRFRFYGENWEIS